MKILFISRIYPNKFNDDGRVIHSQAKELVDQGHEVKVISPMPLVPRFLRHKKDLWEEYSKLPYKDKHDEIEIFRPKYIKLPNTIFDNLMQRVMELSLQSVIFKTIATSLKDFEFNIVHCHMTYPDGIIVRKIRRIYNTPVIVSARSSDLDLSIKDKSKVKVMNNIFKEADEIVTPSSQLQRKLKKAFNQTGKLIGNGVYPEKLENALNDKLVDAYDGNFVILSVSTLTKRKGIEDNIYAISKLIKYIPNLLYLVIGEGPQKGDLKKLVNDLGLNEYVVFLGKLAHDQSMSYMNICDIFSLPSTQETFGLVYLEALYYNKPVILCEHEAISESLSHVENALIVPKNSPNIIAENILNLYKDTKHRKSIASKGKDFVLNNYTWELIGKRLIKLYNQILR